MRSLFLLFAFCLLALGSAAYITELDYDLVEFETMGGKGRGLNLQFAAPIVQQPIVQQPVQLVQPMPVMQQPVLQQAPARSKVRYAQPIVTYAQPIVQPVNMQAPAVEKQHLQASPIVQPTFQTAPVQQVQPIMATAPTIQKGFGTGLGLGAAAGLHQGL